MSIPDKGFAIYSALLLPLLLFNLLDSSPGAGWAVVGILIYYVPVLFSWVVYRIIKFLNDRPNRVYLNELAEQEHKELVRARKLAGLTLKGSLLFVLIALSSVFMDSGRLMVNLGLLQIGELERFFGLMVTVFILSVPLILTVTGLWGLLYLRNSIRKGQATRSEYLRITWMSLSFILVPLSILATIAFYS